MTIPFYHSPVKQIFADLKKIEIESFVVYLHIPVNEINEINIEIEKFEIDPRYFKNIKIDSFYQINKGK